MIGVIKKLLRYKRPAAVATFCMLFFAATAVLFAASPPPGTPIVNTATAQYLDVNQNVYEKISASVTTLYKTPGLSVDKTGSPSAVLAGKEITYNITLKNYGLVTLTNVTVRDTLPAGTSYRGPGEGETLSGGEVLWNIGTLDIGEARILTLIVKTDSSLEDATIIENTARAFCDQTDIQASSFQATITARTPGVMQFFDSQWNLRSVYTVGDTIFIQVADPDQNADSSKIETVSIILTGSQTGDTETIILYETGPDTGVFRGSIPSTGTAPVTENGILSVSEDTTVIASYTDPLDVKPVTLSIAYIDPYGIVFDSVTGTPLPGVIVTLIDSGTGLPATLPFDPNPAPATGADGKYAFPEVPAGTYYLSLSSLPAGYTFPSSVPGSEMPAGYEVINGSRGEPFTLTSLTPPVNIDIPVDPAVPGLAVTKTASRTTASVGDILKYTVTVTNTGKISVTNIKVTDVMPHGIVYVKGSSRLDSLPASDPATPAGRTIVWDIPLIDAEQSIEITYAAIVGVDSSKGSGKNTVTASGISVGQPVSSPVASFTVRINEGIFTSKGTIIGKVFIDNNGNKIQDPGESGIKDVLIYMEDGTRVITDGEGKYSIPGVLPATHVIRIDETTLPAGLRPLSLSNRFAGSSESQFADMKAGGLVKANFALTEKDGPETTKNLQIIHTIQVASYQANASQEAIQATRSLEKEGFRDVRLELIDGKYAVRAGYYDSAESAKEYLGRMKEKHPSAFIRKAYIMPERVIYPAPGETGEAIEETHVKQDLSIQSPEEKQAVMEKEILSMTPELAFISPADGLLLQKKSTNVLLKAPMNTEISLYVNGEKVDESRLGMKVENREGKVTVYEFVGILLKAGEKNILKAEIRDTFGNIRDIREISVMSVGNSHEIIVKPKEKRIQADGITSVGVEAFVKDKNGNILLYPSFMTVETSAGRILEKDADPSMPGTQVPCSNGRAKFTVISPASPAFATVRASHDNLAGEETIFFAPYLRPMMLIGYGELAMGYGKTEGDTSLLDKDWLKKDGISTGGRGAFFLKGGVGKGFLLTAAYDSAKEREDDFFNEHTRNTETEDRYPVYGDESKLEYEAQSREKLYVRIDRDRSYIMYGDFQTDFRDSKLGAYTRTFTGMKSDINTGKFSWQTFLSHTDQVQKVDNIPAKGISGYYYLSSRPVVEGSDMVVIETRDRKRPEHILERKRKTRGTDYVMDYDIGGILFKSAIPSYDSDLNPVFIIVSYETTGTGKKYYIAGTRAAGNLFPWLKAGFTAVREEQEIKDKTIIGADITLTFPGRTTIKAEWAQTESLFETEGIFTGEKDSGWLVELDSKPSDNIILSAYYRNIGDYFGNLSAFDVMRGTERYGMETTYRKDKTTWVKASYYNETDKLNDMEHEYVGIGMGKTFGKTSLEVELYRETANDKYIAPPDPSSRDPFDFSEETPEEATGMRLRLEQKLNPKLSLALEHKQNFLADEGTLSRVDIDYKLDEKRKAYIRQEYGHFDERKETRTAVGIEAELSPSTSAFNEYRLNGGIDGNSSQQSIGIRNKFNLAENITGNLSVEKLDTLSGEERKSRPDAFSAAVGIEYLPDENLKITSRFEHRHERAERSNLAELAIASMFSPSYTFMFRQRLFYNSFTSGGQQITSRTMLGMAYRPVNNDRFNALGRLEFKVDKDTASSPGYDSTSYIASFEANYQLNNRTQLTGKYAGKLAEDYDISSYTDLLSGRFMYDINDRFDIGIEGRLLNSYRAGTTLFGGSAEIGCRIVKNLWLSLGYSFDNFDEDLTGNSYSGKGPYLMLRFKLHENLFK